MSVKNSKLYDILFPKNHDCKKISFNKHKSKTYVLTIQILFGIIIGISFTDYHNELVPFELNFETGMIFLAYGTVLLSLVGYSITIKYRYHRNFIRFSLDIFLLYLYYQLVYSPQNSFSYFLWIFPIIFSVYNIWQVFEYLEWKRDDKNKYSWKEFRKIFVGTLLFTIVFFIIAASYVGSITIGEKTQTNDILNYWPVTIVEQIFLILIAGLIVGFRVFIFKISILKENDD